MSKQPLQGCFSRKVATTDHCKGALELRVAGAIEGEFAHDSVEEEDGEDASDDCPEDKGVEHGRVVHVVHCVEIFTCSSIACAGELKHAR